MKCLWQQFLIWFTVLASEIYLLCTSFILNNDGCFVLSLFSMAVVMWRMFEIIAAISRVKKKRKNDDFVIGYDGSKKY